ncbi:helix-turn-helix domain-containing protein [Hyphomicrobium nitrativorans]|uniref:helix-turn-helix domain-containing protein n=1 Tax=Hyphomicrobium nitrativorans TaxID=1427356 RepID=UPI003CC6E555
MLRLTEGVMLKPAEVARHLRVSVGHLGFMRRHGGGPRYVMVGRHVRYRHADVLAFEINRSSGPVSPDAIALALASVPGLPPKVRDVITSHVTAVLFPPSEPRPRRRATQLTRK